MVSAAPSPSPFPSASLSAARGASMVGPGISSSYNHTFPTTTTAVSIGGGGCATTTAGITEHTDQQQPLQPQAEEVDKLNLDFTTLFLEAKSEVLKLLKQDNFPRWQRTVEFTHFIETMIAKDAAATQVAKEEEIFQAQEYSLMLTTGILIGFFVDFSIIFMGLKLYLYYLYEFYYILGIMLLGFDCIILIFYCL